MFLFEKNEILIHPDGVGETQESSLVDSYKLLTVDELVQKIGTTFDFK